MRIHFVKQRQPLLAMLTSLVRPALGDQRVGEEIGLRHHLMPPPLPPLQTCSSIFGWDRLENNLEAKAALLNPIGQRSIIVILDYSKISTTWCRQDPWVAPAASIASTTMSYRPMQLQKQVHDVFKSLMHVMPPPSLNAKLGNLTRSGHIFVPGSRFGRVNPSNPSKLQEICQFSLWMGQTCQPGSMGQRRRIMNCTEEQPEKYGMMGGLVCEAVTAVPWSQQLNF